MLRDLGLDAAASDYARNLRAQPGLADLTELVAAAETGSSMLLIPGLGARNIATECWFAGIDAEGNAIAASFGVEEQDAANLADITADAGIARGFLNTYLESRRNAGWTRPE